LSGVVANFSAAHLDQWAADVKRLGLELGFTKLGIANTKLDADEQHLNRWLERGRHGAMTYMERHGSKRARPAELVPGTVTVISARMDYWPAAAHDGRATLSDPSTGYVVCYAPAATTTRFCGSACAVWPNADGAGR
jgi:epoxyqueuosine reductase